jgi:23S rRNA (cytidine1920-2'-O)/16S rRNA (cytidine1409-2'-O)-methyltransferase
VAERTLRLDQWMAANGLAESRSAAQRLIMAGEVLVGGQPVFQPSTRVKPGTSVVLRAPARYVSRGGEKLEAALDRFGVRPGGWTCADVGASTGGFTDCLLQRGASRVFAVDVGTAQLDAKLRKDPRVVVMEQTNARSLDPRVFDEQPSLAVVDVSFISLEKILPAVFGVLAPRSEIVALVKPQFEVGRAQVGKGGVVRDPAQHRACVQRLARYAVLRGWHVLSVTASPLRGPKGNREFFLHLSAQGRTAANLESLIERTVVEALA